VVGGITGGVIVGVDTSSGGVAMAPSTGTVRKTRDVRPVWPEAARRADIHGTVIVALNIGTDGSVTHARILRSVPQLDEAALECVREWRYEPTLLNGRAVPVTITAAVSFP
jgi:protein TonB